MCALGHTFCHLNNYITEVSAAPILAQEAMPESVAACNGFIVPVQHLCAYATDQFAYWTPRTQTQSYRLHRARV